jgi:signal transduction histidine kinase
MLLLRIDQRLATAIRLAGLALISYSVLSSHHHPAASGRGLVTAICLTASVLAWLAWTFQPNREHGISPDVVVMAGVGGVLCGAASDSASSAFVFIAVVAAGLRVELARAVPVLALGALTLGVSTLIYNGSTLGALAYTLGFAAASLAASNSRQSIQRADQAELLLAQTQRSHEEQLRTTRLQETTRIAREIHDVLAHALAGLTLQLEATISLLEQGADRETALRRLHRAHELAREGLQETRRAVGALRGDAPTAPQAIEALVDDYRMSTEAPAELLIDGDRARLGGAAGQAAIRVIQEALTNVRKHAAGAGVSVAVHAGSEPADEIVVRVDDRPRPGAGDAGAAAAGATTAGAPALAATGGGYGLQGMRERAQLLGGTLSAGTCSDDGWRVELRLPAPSASGDPHTP